VCPERSEVIHFSLHQSLSHPENNHGGRRSAGGPHQADLAFSSSFASLTMRNLVRVVDDQDAASRGFLMDRRQPKHSRFEMTSRHPCLSARQCHTPVSRAHPGPWPRRLKMQHTSTSAHLPLEIRQPNREMPWLGRRDSSQYGLSTRFAVVRNMHETIGGFEVLNTPHVPRLLRPRPSSSAELFMSSMNLMSRMLPLLLYAAHRGPCLIILAQTRLFLISEPFLPPPACQPRSLCAPSLPSSEAPGLGV
jgi:hypothetical protein